MNVYQTSQVVLVVKNLLANAGDIRDTGSSLGWVDPLEEGMATHSSILAWRSPWTEEPGRLQCMGSQREIWLKWLIMHTWMFTRTIVLLHCLFSLYFFNGFFHTLIWINHGFACVPLPNPPSRLPLHPIPLGLPSAPALSTCLMHPTWAGNLFHPW